MRLIWYTQSAAFIAVTVVNYGWPPQTNVKDCRRKCGITVHNYMMDDVRPSLLLNVRRDAFLDSPTCR